MASSTIETINTNVDLPYNSLSKKLKSSTAEVTPLHLPVRHRKNRKHHPSKESMNNEEMIRNKTTLGSEPDGKDNVKLHQTTFIWPKHSNQAYANAKNFYKKFIDTETKTKRLKLYHGIQKKKSESSPQVEQRMKERDMNRLIETNLRLFRNMNNIFGSNGHSNPARFLNDSSFTTQGEQPRHKEYRSVSSNTKKYESKIVGYGRSQIFIPVETSQANDDDLKMDYNNSVFEADFLSNKRVLTTAINHSDRRELQTAPSPNKSRRVSVGNTKRGNSEKKNLSIDYYLNRDYRKKDASNKIGFIDMVPGYSGESINSAMTMNSIIYERPMYRIPENLNQTLANLIHESGSINKNTLNLMTKMVSQVNRELSPEGRGRTSTRGTPTKKYNQREFWILNEKSKRSSSFAG